MSTEERLFRPRFQPVAQIGEIVALRTGDGFITDDAAEDIPFYQVTHVEASVVLGVKGTIVVWSATNAPAAPYQTDKGSVVGQNLGVTIAASATLPFQPAFFGLQTRQFGQYRFLARAVPDSNAAALTGSIDDYDIRVSVPPGTARYGTQRVIGVLNAAFQGHLPSDTAAAPAQGTNFTASANLDFDPFDKAARSELFAYGPSANNGQINITNNGSATATTGAIGLHVGLFTFNIMPVPAASVQPGWHLGYKVPIPQIVRELPHGLHSVINIPVTGQSQPKGKGQ